MGKFPTIARADTREIDWKEDEGGANRATEEDRFSAYSLLANLSRIGPTEGSAASAESKKIGDSTQPDAFLEFSLVDSNSAILRRKGGKCRECSWFANRERCAECNGDGEANERGLAGSSRLEDVARPPRRTKASGSIDRSHDRSEDFAPRIRPRLAGFGRSGSRNVSRAIVLGLLVGSLLCVPAPGASMPSVLALPASSGLPPGAWSPSSATRGTELTVAQDGAVESPEESFGDAFETDDIEDSFAASPRDGTLDENELEIVRRSILRGLGLRTIPDVSKANVSQIEYERAHREYLRRLQPWSEDGESDASERRNLHVYHATAYPGNGSSGNVLESGPLFFPVEIPQAEESIGRSSVDHATLRLLLEPPPDQSPVTSDLRLFLYLKGFASRVLIGRKRIDPLDAPHSRWIEVDSTAAVSSWLEAGHENLGLEIEFRRNGDPVRCRFSSPVLNVFTSEVNAAGPFEAAVRRKRSYPEDLMTLHKRRRTKCKGESKKCCRHELTVMFKDLKGFEFIVYPKMFDAGFCKGRCPPRYNPAHHHALLQSLLWKEDRKKVPKPCCAPSKLEQLMIVYFDENDATRLKVSYWKNIQVIECACS